MICSTTRTVDSAVNMFDVSALFSLEALNHRLMDGSFTFHLSEVKGSVMDGLKRSRFLNDLTGKVLLTQYDAVAGINPDLARRTLTCDRTSAQEPAAGLDAEHLAVHAIPPGVRS